MNNTFETHKEYWIDEYHHGTRYGIKGEILVQTKSKFQEILIIKSKFLGNALLLNNCWMISEKHDNHYHECLIHPALSCAKTIEKILIIGGGDGGSAKECLKYSAVKEIDLVEIDELVVELSKKYLQKINKDIWDNKKLNIHIKDGIEWVKSTEYNSYDVVIIDCSDPKGTSKGLFSLAFLKDCKRILKYGGVFATQSESPESFIGICSSLNKPPYNKRIRFTRFDSRLYYLTFIYINHWMITQHIHHIIIPVPSSFIERI